jgi:hypothetical protein
VDTSGELLPAFQTLTVLADGIDLGLDRAQTRELLDLAGQAARRGHIRLLGTVHDGPSPRAWTGCRWSSSAARRGCPLRVPHRALRRTRRALSPRCGRPGQRER